MERTLLVDPLSLTLPLGGGRELLYACCWLGDSDKLLPCLSGASRSIYACAHTGDPGGHPCHRSSSEVLNVRRIKTLTVVEYGEQAL